MTELEKYELINQAEDIESLQNAFDKVFEDEPQVITKRRTAMAASKEQIREYIKELVLDPGHANPSYLTRRYGLRQQALYLQYYRSY